MVPDPVVTLPYGCTRHMEAVLSYSGSQGLLAGEVMGTCRRATTDINPADLGPTTPQNAPQPVNSVLGQCGAGRLKCPRGTATCSALGRGAAGPAALSCTHHTTRPACLHRGHPCSLGAVVMPSVHRVLLMVARRAQNKTP